MGFMKEEPEVEAVDIDHNSFLLSSISVLIPIELQIPILIKTFLLAASGYIVKNVHLAWDLSMVGGQLDLPYVHYPIEL